MDNKKAVKLAMLSTLLGIKEEYAMKIINKIVAEKKKNNNSSPTGGGIGG